jgi:hypothetical protein
MANEFVNVHDLTIDLIDTVNPSSAHSPSSRSRLLNRCST